MDAKVFLLPLLFLVVTGKKSGAQIYRDRLDSCSKQMQKPLVDDSIYADLVIERDACMIGAVAPRFEAMTVSGVRYDHTDFTGKVVVLHFWSTTCGPCIEEIPWLNEVYELYRDSNVVFLSFAPEPAEKLNVFLNTHSLRFPVVARSSRLAYEVFGLTAFLPYTIIIDKKSRISRMWFGSFLEETVSTYAEEIAAAAAR